MKNLPRYTFNRVEAFVRDPLKRKDLMQNTTGFHYLTNGFSLLTKPGLKRFVVIPVLINICLFFCMFFFVKHYFVEFNNWIIGILPSWLHWLSHILWILFFIGFFLITIYAFVTIANLIAAPFNSLLAEKVEIYLTKENLPTTHFLNDIPRVVIRQLAIIGYFIPRAIVLLLLFFVPIVQFVAGFLWFIFHAWLMALQYLDYPTDNHKIPFSKVCTELYEKKWLSLSFGVSVLVLSMIPILNWFVMPAAVAGATQLWVEQFKKN